ncbi:MAG: TetR/AcrR family transcriptional regulator [Nevskia sp.]|nr:TetR/AcrR family transcriptional regulator [Nevskia sp.]
MRNRAWKGTPPGSDSEARQRLRLAALRCVKYSGVEGISVSSIAREAGITRQTFYRYFENAEDVTFSTVASASGTITTRLFKHLEQFDAREDRAVEALVFLYREMPKDRLLKEVFFEAPLHPTTVGQVFTQRALQRCKAIAAEIMRIDDPGIAEEENLHQLGEFMLRLLWSVLINPTNSLRDEHEFRAFLRKWLAIPVRTLFGETNGRAMACPELPTAVG